MSVTKPHTTHPIGAAGADRAGETPRRVSGLHVLTDAREGRDALGVVAAAVAAGAPVVQVRVKGSTDRVLYDFAGSPGHLPEAPIRARSKTTVPGWGRAARPQVPG